MYQLAVVFSHIQPGALPLPPPRFRSPFPLPPPGGKNRAIANVSVLSTAPSPHLVKRCEMKRKNWPKIYLLIFKCLLPLRKLADRETLRRWPAQRSGSVDGRCSRSAACNSVSSWLPNLTLQAMLRIRSGFGLEPDPIFKNIRIRIPV